MATAKTSSSTSGSVQPAPKKPSIRLSDRGGSGPPHPAEPAFAERAERSTLLIRKHSGSSYAQVCYPGYQTPETWTARDRLLGPSNSAKMMLCHVPTRTEALHTWRQSV